ncbi:MAG: flagellar FlbD family protein [Halanaerobiaceae bacterium]
MIEVKRMDGETIVINAELIETVRATPDTVITLTNDKTILVQNGVEEIVAKVINYRQKVHFRPTETEE